MQLSVLLQHVPHLGVSGPLDRDVDHVTRDSRHVGPTTVFVAVSGAKVDGHSFVPDLPAAVVVVERDVDVAPGVTCVRVSSTKDALGAIAAALFDFPSRSMSVVGITGTNGKTTTTTLVEQALRALSIRVGRIGTTGNAIDGAPIPAAFTTPEAPELQGLLASMRDAGCTVVVMEVSSIGLAQRRVDGTSFAVGVFTNLTQDHLDFHGTFDAYREAKARLFRELLRPPGGAPRALMSADDPASDALDPPEDAWTFGFSDAADLHIARLRLSGGGSQIGLVTPDGPVEIGTRLVGRHNALNVAAAFGVLRCVGVSAEDAAAALGTAVGAPGRLERVPDPMGGRLVLVDYAHSDDALLNVLPTARELTMGTLWLVFGCGGDRDRGKRPKMGAVAARLADRLVITSDNPRSEDPASIVADILGGLPDRQQVHVELDREAAIRWALDQAASGDVVLIAGKGHETTQEIGGKKTPFDDREVARRILAGR